MGSFTSAPKIMNDDTQDEDVLLPERQTREEVLARCRRELADRRPVLVKRVFCHATSVTSMGSVVSVAPGAPTARPAVRSDAHTDAHTDASACALEPLHESAFPHVSAHGARDDGDSCPFVIRVLQWNILSQTLGKSNDNFVCCPDEALEWSTRRFQIIQEIVQYSPDVICLQEVDHFNFLQNILGSLGYNGTFFPKPDSPCLYIPGNNGPDGCAIFYSGNKFELIKTELRILEVWRVQSNQVALLCVLKVRGISQEVCIATTHLKARSGALLATLRNEQGKDLLEFISVHAEGRPVILCGDFNAEPIEPVYMTLLSHPKLSLSSAYAALDKNRELETSQKSQELIHVHTSINREPPYTTWKIREEGEICHTIDYIFYSNEELSVDGLLEFPSGEKIGKNRVPSMSYPSDHFSLCADFRFKSKSQNRS